MKTLKTRKGKKRSVHRSVFDLYPLPPPQRSVVVVFSFLPTSLPSALRSFWTVPKKNSEYVTRNNTESFLAPLKRKPKI